MNGSIILSVVFLVMILVMSCGGRGTNGGNETTSVGPVEVTVSSCVWKKTVGLGGYERLEVEVTAYNKSNETQYTDLIIQDSTGSTYDPILVFGFGGSELSPGERDHGSIRTSHFPFESTDLKLIVSQSGVSGKVTRKSLNLSKCSSPSSSRGTPATTATAPPPPPESKSVDTLVIRNPVASLSGLTVYGPDEVPVNQDGYIYLVGGNEAVRLKGPPVSATGDLSLERLFFLEGENIEKELYEGFLVVVNSHLTYFVAFDDFEDEVDLALVEISRSTSQLNSIFTFVGSEWGVAHSVQITPVIDRVELAGSVPVGIEVSGGRDESVVMTRIQAPAPTPSAPAPTSVPAPTAAPISAPTAGPTPTRTASSEGVITLTGIGGPSVGLPDLGPNQIMRIEMLSNDLYATGKTAGVAAISLWGFENAEAASCQKGWWRDVVPYFQVPGVKCGEILILVDGEPVQFPDGKTSRVIENRSTTETISVALYLNDATEYWWDSNCRAQYIFPTLAEATKYECPNVQRYDGHSPGDYTGYAVFRVEIINP